VGDRRTIAVGCLCAVCRRDQWEVRRGFNRCRCGQTLWIERWKDDRGGVRFRYRQGSSLPTGYQGWLAVTN